MRRRRPGSASREAVLPQHTAAVATAMTGASGSGPPTAAFTRLRDLFLELVELPEPDRAQRIERVAADDPDLRCELLALLEHDVRRPPDEQARPEIERAIRSALPDAFPEGRLLGAYRVIELIGGGGMGRVYRAVRADGETEMQVAIKLLRAELVNPALLERFTNERAMLAALDHPGICRFIDAGRLDNGAPYVVMEYVSGEPLFAYCDRQQLTLEQRLGLLQQVLCAVQYAHRQLIVHRDIKSDNILIGADGRPRLLDFGIAKRLGGAGAASVTATAERYCTLASAAPEQLRGEPVGIATDIYAIGVLAYELLTGSTPFGFDGLTAAEVERRLLHVPPPLMSQTAANAAATIVRRRSLPDAASCANRLRGDLDSIVATCLRKAPSERYPSVEALGADLDARLAMRPIAVRGGERWYRWRRFARRHQWALAVSAAFATTVLSATTLVFMQSLELGHRHAEVLAERDRAQHVVRLLQQAFAAANPVGSTSESVRAIDVLDAVRPMLDQLHGEQPSVHAALALTIAAIDLDLNRFAAASALSTRGIDAAQRSGATTVLRDLLLLDARIATALGDYPRAERRLEEMARLDPSLRPDWMVARGKLRLQQGRRMEAVFMFSQALDALELRDARAGDPAVDLALRARADWSTVLRLDGAFDDALALLDESIAFQMSVFGPTHPRTTVDALARLNLLREVQPDRAEQRLTDTGALLATIEQQFGPDSTMASRAHASIGFTLRELGRHHDAAAAFRRSLAILERINGPDNPFTLLVGSYLAEALDIGGAHDAQAEALFRVALDGLSRRNSDQLVIARLRSGFAAFLHTRSRTEEALGVLATVDLTHSWGASSETRRHIRDTALAIADDPLCNEPARLDRCDRLRVLIDATPDPTTQ